MELKCFLRKLDTIAPQSLALEYDRVGLLIGTHRDVKRVLLALDCTDAVAREAVDINADLVLTHHPLFFKGITRILPDDDKTSAAYILIQHGIGLYSAHTNLDSVPDGVNDTIAENLGIADCTPFGEGGIGRIGQLRSPVPLKDLIVSCNHVFRTKCRYSGELTKVVQKVGIVGGAGGDFVQDAVLTGCDALITGELKHHEAIQAIHYGLTCIVGGHYETEVLVLKKWISRLQNTEDDVEYYESEYEQSPLSIYEEDKR